MRRRRFIQTAGAAATGSLAIGRASATHFDSQPPHVTLDFPTPEIDTYRPTLTTHHLNVEPLGLYGMRATSPEHDTDVYVYGVAYTHQESASPLSVISPDAHFGDHEWWYTVVDSDSGDVVEAIYSAGHWVRGRTPAASLPIEDDTHPAAHIVSPWHHHRPDPEKRGRLLSVSDLKPAYRDWLRNGLEQDVQPGAVVNPWLMETRNHWWRDSRRAFQADIANTIFGIDP